MTLITGYDPDSQTEVPIQVDENGVVQTSGGSGGGGGAVTIADGADSTQGAKADATASAATLISTPATAYSEIQLLKALVDGLGERTASPTSNTLQSRLKAVADALTTLQGYTDGLETINAAIRDRLPTSLDTGGYLTVAPPATKVFTSNLTLDTSAYATGDTLADILEVTNAVRFSNGTGIIQEISVIDKDDQGIGFDILIFNQTFTLTGLKNAAWAVADGDMDNCQGIVSVSASDFVDTGGNRIATKSNLGIPIQPAATSLFIGTISRGAGTYTANGLRLKISILRD